MDWGFITHHLISGFIPIMVALVVCFILTHVIGKKIRGVGLLKKRIDKEKHYRCIPSLNGRLQVLDLNNSEIECNRTLRIF